MHLQAPASVAPSSLRDDEAADNLTDEQIEQLLKNAADRMTRTMPADIAGEVTSATDKMLRCLKRWPRLDPGIIPQPYITSNSGIAQTDPARLLDDWQRQLSGKPREVEDAMKGKRELKKANAGPNWYYLPRTNLTSELKRDLQLLKMRSVLDPKRHYKKEKGNAKAPIFSQTGTILEGPAEFYSARLLNKDRKLTLMDEVTAREESAKHFKKKYNSIQSMKISGKQAYYKALKAKRSIGTRKYLRTDD
ncbi:hypothetical protein MMC06_001743 [Schaereria dolodes]|nr:hypothetical protein [Schaereria dolodes]